MLEIGRSIFEWTKSARKRRSVFGNGCQFAPSLKTLRRSACNAGLPPVMAVASTVWPVVKSKIRVPGVSSTGSPSCSIDGAPSSRVQLPSRLSRSTGDQFRPAPSFVSVPKSEKCSTSALPLSVRLPSALKSRLRREIGRSMFTPACSVVRPSELELLVPSRSAVLSWWTVVSPGSLSRCVACRQMEQLAIGITGEVTRHSGVASAVKAVGASAASPSCHVPSPRCR